jgi:hypothetical protein
VASEDERLRAGACVWFAGASGELGKRPNTKVMEGQEELSGFAVEDGTLLLGSEDEAKVPSGSK